MVEYIEKHKLLQDMHSVHTLPIFHKTDEDYMFERMVGIVNEQPSADVVKVVRCKDCKHCEHINDEFSKDWYQCKRRGNSFQRKPTDFCSYGELKEREGK